MHLNIIIRLLIDWQLLLILTVQDYGVLPQNNWLWTIFIKRLIPKGLIASLKNSLDLTKPGEDLERV